MTAALSSLKVGKAPGPDILLIHMSSHANNWLRNFFSFCMASQKIPKIWRLAKVIAILKLNKPVEEAISYHLASLLCISYKILERHNRIMPIVDPKLPHTR